MQINGMVFIVTLLLSQVREHPKASEPAAWGPEVDGFQLSVATEKSLYKKGEFVDVTIRLKNKGPRECSIPMSLSFPFRPELRHLNSWLPLGQEAEFTPLGRRTFVERNSSDMDSQTFRVRSGETREFPYRLNALFQLDRASEYSLVLTCAHPMWLSDHEARGKFLVSNRIKFRITNEQFVPEESNRE